MSVVKIRGVDVKFPYEKPYDIQIAYMEKVVDCLEGKRHGVLESPTGTGKTLCLFAPVTSWLRSKKNLPVQSPIKNEPNDGMDNPTLFWPRKQKVYYTARTHSQIAQTVAEVRRCDIEGLSVRVMGARDQLCVNPLVVNEKDSYIKTVKCKELVKAKSCRFHRKLDYEKHASQIYQQGEVLDIEDLAAAGRTCGICPYFLAKTAKDSADVVLMPYNYIIDRESRGTTGGGYDNAIVIFDEGHNVPNTCEESFEFAITSVDLALGMRNIQELMEALANIKQLDVGDEGSLDMALHADNCMQIAAMLKNLEAGLAQMAQSSQLYPLSDLYAFFERAGVTAATAASFITILASFQEDATRLQINGPMLTTFNLLERVLQTLFGPAIGTFPKEMVEKSFKFSVAPDTEMVRNSKKLSLFCFNPSFGIKEVLLLGVQSLIITSGTLSPLKSFIYELGLPDPVTLENGHIASKSQVPFMVLGTGVNNVKMDATFKNRKEPAYMYSLGMTLTNLISSVPDGVLLLFSSYSMMSGLKESWESEGGIWNRLNSIKRVFVEPRGKEEFINCMENFRRAIDAGNGAVLMGVLRGKISEGMDFKDQYCRAVFVVGVPFPPIMDPRVKGKEKYSETLFVENPVTKRNEKLYGSNFISVEAMKATNQAIGRVIRHGGDYGAIILVDYRFAWPRLFNTISGWLRGDRPVEVNFMTAKKTLREFFRNLQDGKLGVTEIRCQAVNGYGDPIAGDVKYDIYDHKKARNQVPAPWISAGLDTGNYRKSKIEYEDESADSGVDLMSKYGSSIGSGSASPFRSTGSGSPSPFRRGGNGSPSPFKTKLQSSSRTPIKTEPVLFHEALESGNVHPHEYTGYREVDMAVLNEELQKRKNEDTSPSLLCQKKKTCRRMVVPSLVSYEPEPESALAPVANACSSASSAKFNGVVRNDLINYIVRAKGALPPSTAVQFKEAAWKYMKGEVPLPETLALIRKLFQNTAGSLEYLLGFSICVRQKDKSLWEELSQGWR